MRDLFKVLDFGFRVPWNLQLRIPRKGYTAKGLRGSQSVSALRAVAPASELMKSCSSKTKHIHLLSHIYSYVCTCISLSKLTRVRGLYWVYYMLGLVMDF